MDLLTKEELELIGYIDVLEESIRQGKSIGLQYFEAGGYQQLPGGPYWFPNIGHTEKLLDLYWQLSFVPGYTKIVEKPRKHK